MWVSWGHDGDLHACTGGGHCWESWQKVKVRRKPKAVPPAACGVSAYLRGALRGPRDPCKFWAISAGLCPVLKMWVALGVGQLGNVTSHQTDREAPVRQ